MVRETPGSTSVKSRVSLATCITLFLSEEYAIRALPSSSCRGRLQFLKSQVERAR